MGIVVKACLLVVRYTIFNWFFWLLAGLVAAIKSYLTWARSFLICPGRINGKTVIITGANTGMGFELAKTLASRGARIIMACRNMGSAHQAKAAIAYETGNSNIAINQLDLSSLWSVRQFARAINESEVRIDVLIHCAAILGKRDSKSKDDLQISWQINHLSPFLLTHLLMDLMKRSSPSRVIFMSSTSHHFSKLDIDSVNNATSGHFRTFSDISLANILTSNLLAEKLKGTGVTSNVSNPGLVKAYFRRLKNQYAQKCLQSFLDFFAKTMEEGAATTIMLAVKPELEEVTGKYFSECKVSGCLSKKSKDVELAEKIWKKNEQLVGLEEYEKI